nr:acyltransferase [Clostridium gasigenes]
MLGRFIVGKIKFLDGLRGGAAFIVVIAHYIQVFYPTVFNGNIESIHTKNNLELIFYKTPLNLFFNANFCVCIFFVLSGYVLSIKFFKHNDKEIIISGMLKRYLRLAIPVLAVLTLSYLMRKCNLFYFGDVSSITKTEIMNRYLIKYDYIDILKQSLFQIFIFDIETYNAVLWTMKYEFIGSFIVFFILILFSHCKHKKTLSIALILIFLNSYYLGFVLGCLLSYISINKKIKIKKITLKFLLLISLFFGSYPYYQGSNSIYYIISIKFGEINNFILFHTLGGALLVFVIINFKTLQNIFSSRTMVFLGKISFSLYLVHFLFINSLGCYIFIKTVNYFNYHISFLVSFIITFLFSIVTAYSFNRIIDTPAIYLSNKFSKFILDKFKTKKIHFLKLNNGMVYKYSNALNSYTENIRNNDTQVYTMKEK